MTDGSGWSFAPRPRKKQRTDVVLACTACGSRNYDTTKTARDGTPPLILKKFCKTCNRHTRHEEAH